MTSVRRSASRSRSVASRAGASAAHRSPSRSCAEAMALPETVRAPALRKLKGYCERRAPEHVRDEVQVEARVRGDKITIVERRAPWRPDFGPEWTESKVAQIEFHPAMRTWRLFAYDAMSGASTARSCRRRVTSTW